MASSTRSPAAAARLGLRDITPDDTCWRAARDCLRSPPSRCATTAIDPRRPGALPGALVGLDGKLGTGVGIMPPNKLMTRLRRAHRRGARHVLADRLELTIRTCPGGLAVDGQGNLYCARVAACGWWNVRRGQTHHRRHWRGGPGGRGRPGVGARASAPPPPHRGRSVGRLHLGIPPGPRLSRAAGRSPSFHGAGLATGARMAAPVSVLAGGAPLEHGQRADRRALDSFGYDAEGLLASKSTTAMATPTNCAARP